jgi:hypothetical protein
LSTINVFLEVYDSNQARQHFRLAPNLPISTTPETFIANPKQWSTIKSLQGFPKLPVTQTGCVDEFMDSSAMLFLDELEYMKDDYRMEEDRDSQIYHELDQLLRKGLRSLIVERGRQSDTDTQSSGDKDLQSLSRIVPSVFSLGYRQVLFRIGIHEEGHIQLTHISPSPGHEPAFPLDSVHREVPGFSSEDDEKLDFAKQNQRPSSFA